MSAPASTGGLALPPSSTSADAYPDSPWIVDTQNGFINGTLIDSRGSYGVVYLGVPRNKDTHHHCAFKVMRPIAPGMRSMQPKEFDREIGILKYVRDHIRLKDHGSNETTALHGLYDGWQVGNGHYVLAVENLMGGDLYKYLYDALAAGTPLTEREVRRFMTPLFQAIKKLHEHKIVHCDIKVENLAFRDVDHKQLVLIDMGLAWQLKWPQADGDNTPPALDYRCPYYPKEIKDRIITPALDAYLLGYVLFFLLTGNKYVARDDMDFPQTSLVSERGKSLILRLLHDDWRKRPTIEEALSDPWFSMPDSELSAVLPAISIGASDAASEGEALAGIRAHQEVVEKPKIAVLQTTLEEKKLTILTSLATQLKDKKRKHDSEGIATAGPFATLNSGEFVEALQVAGLPFLASDAIFDLADVDCNGSVDYREITLLLRSLGLFTTSQILSHFCFKVLDVDGSDTLSRAELTAALSNMIFTTSIPAPAAQAPDLESTASHPTLVRTSSSQKVEIKGDALDLIFDHIGMPDGQDMPKQLFLDWALERDDGTDSPDNIARRFVTGSLFAHREEQHAAVGEASESSGGGGGGGVGGGGGDDA